MDECSKVREFQVQENNCDAHNYSLHAVYADIYMKYVELEPGGLTDWYSCRIMKTRNTFLTYLV